MNWHPIKRAETFGKLRRIIRSQHNNWIKIISISESLENELSIILKLIL